jgi:TIR domain/SIR2-like domain
MAVFAAEEEDYWPELLQLIRDNLVIPVIGSELLQIGDELLYQRLARDLAAELKLTGEPPASLHDVACRYLEERRAKSLSAVYVTLRRLLETPGKYPVPETLRKLAEIAPLRLFLTTTFDTVLEKALDEARYKGRPTTRAIAYSLDYGGDLPDELKGGGAPDPPIVFHLFGLPAPFNKFAVTDEDVLEYVHSLQSGTHRPETLFQYVADKHLLIIGSSFSDWLARFFIRSAKRERLWNARGREDFLVDPGRDRSSLSTFVQHFGGGMKVFSRAPAEFVDELHRRWLAEQPVPAAVEMPAASADGELRKMKSGSIFLSYASEDRAIADAIARQLDEAKLDVWIDHRKLRGGQNFEYVIRRNIKEASLFIALISRQALTGGYSFFRTEWLDALETARGMPPSPPFVILVFIDETRIDPGRGLFPPKFSESHWEIAENGVLSARQLESIVEFFVEQQRLREVAR